MTLAVMTPHTHDYEFEPLPPSTIALRVRDVAEAKALRLRFFSLRSSFRDLMFCCVYAAC